MKSGSKYTVLMLLNYPYVLILGNRKTMNFPFGRNGKLMVLNVPILKHYRVLQLHLEMCQCYEAKVTGTIITLTMWLFLNGCLT